jgi:hypothetical protein
MFSIDYTTLYQIIQQHMYTGIFRAKVSVSRSWPEEGHIELQVKDGIICTCCFITTQGKVYKWDKWETQLAQFGVLNWEQTSLRSSGPAPQMSSSPRLVSSQPSSAVEDSQSSTKVPVHISANILASSQMHLWPVLYRRVYSLIDGKRQCADIAMILHRSEHEIASILDVLHQQDLIRWR